MTQPPLKLRDAPVSNVSRAQFNHCSILWTVTTYAQTWQRRFIEHCCFQDAPEDVRDITLTVPWTTRRISLCFGFLRDLGRYAELSPRESTRLARGLGCRCNKIVRGCIAKHVTSLETDKKKFKKEVAACCSVSEFECVCLRR